MHRAVVLLAAGCGFQTAELAPDAGAPGAGDAPPDAAAICVGSFIAVCRSAVPDSVSLLVPAQIDTDRDPRCAAQSQGADVPALCVIAGQDVTVSAPITAIGRRPLVLAAFRNLSVTPTGLLSVTSFRGLQPGAGANDPGCGTPSDGTSSLSGAGGGAGGSFHGSGGAGKAGSSGTAAAGSPAGPIASVGRVTGGCRGSKGGAAGAHPGGAPGNGGGAVLLVAGAQLAIAGVVTAGGGGGDAPEAFGGGGGGGSGGFIGLDGAAYLITGIVAANGGGGSSGGTSQGMAIPGEDGKPSDASAASGGFALSGAGPGGDGSLATMLDGQPAVAGVVAAGGGGGGSSGLILVTHARPVGAFSPPPTGP